MKYFEIPIEIEKEDPKETMKYIESKRNWDVKNQQYRIDPKEEYRIEQTTNLSE